MSDKGARGDTKYLKVERGLKIDFTKREVLHMGKKFFME